MKIKIIVFSLVLCLAVYLWQFTDSKIIIEKQEETINKSKSTLEIIEIRSDDKFLLDDNFQMFLLITTHEEKIVKIDDWNSWCKNCADPEEAAMKMRNSNKKHPNYWKGRLFQVNLQKCTIKEIKIPTIKFK